MKNIKPTGTVEFQLEGNLEKGLKELRKFQQLHDECEAIMYHNGTTFYGSESISEQLERHNERLSLRIDGEE